MREDEAQRTLLDLLTADKMDASDSTVTARSDGAESRWTTLKQRLGLKRIICCGSGWNRSSSSSSALLPVDDSPIPVNLATALAEERQLRQLNTSNSAPLLEFEAGSSSLPVTPTKVSLMRLMAEAAMEGSEEEGEKSKWCCVCMERKKGAAFIPCGHTFCRVCSRELCLNRGRCPLCNRSILDVLDIF